MSSLVEMLRDFAGDAMGMEPADRQVLSEAADELERLQRNYDLLAHAMRQQEHIEKLWKPLVELLADTFGWGKRTDANGEEQFYPLRDELLQMIRTALAGEEDDRMLQDRFNE